MPIAQCIVCGTALVAYRQRQGTAVVCSSCIASGARLQVHCERCGRAYTAPARRVNRGLPLVCARSCPGIADVPELAQGQADGAECRIPLLGRKRSLRAWTVVDRQDASLRQWRWYLNGRGYAYRFEPLSGSRRQLILLHREVLGLPRIGDDRQGDHINGDRLDNRRANLRVVSQAANTRNQPAPDRSATGIKGVYLHRETGRYVAQISLGGRTHALGLYPTMDAAMVVALTARLCTFPDLAVIADQWLPRQTPHYLQATSRRRQRLQEETANGSR